jgi:hypothetical protein
MWTDSQRKDLKLEYNRIGIRDDDLLRTPSKHLSAQEFLAMVRLIPDGAGKAGYEAALAASA